MMKKYTAEELKEILANHRRLLYSLDGIKERANLRDADLRYANLCGANLCNTDLRNTDLRYADLRGANLCGANLCNTDLRYADLRGADLCDADLCGATRNLRHIKSLQTETYYITYTAEVIQIGCHPYRDWENFNDDELLKMDGQKALNWWKKWKPILMKIIEIAPCEPTKDKE